MLPLSYCAHALFPGSSLPTLSFKRQPQSGGEPTTTEHRTRLASGTREDQSFRVRKAAAAGFAEAGQGRSGFPFKATQKGYPFKATQQGYPFKAAQHGPKVVLPLVGGFPQMVGASPWNIPRDTLATGILRSLECSPALTSCGASCRRRTGRLDGATGRES